MLRRRTLPPRDREAAVAALMDSRRADMAREQLSARALARGSGLVAAALALPELDPEPQAATAAGRRHMGRVAALGCVVCRRLGYGPTSAEVHHVRWAAGGGERASSWLTVPLCPEHHRGAGGFHQLGRRPFERRYGIDEPGMLAQTIADLVG